MSSITSHIDLVSQAGVSTSILKNFKSTTTENSTNYPNFAPINSLYPFGTYTTAKSARKVIGHVPSKLSRALSLVENDEQYPDIDIILEGGLGTVYMYTNNREITSDVSSRTAIENEENNDDF